MAAGQGAVQPQGRNVWTRRDYANNLVYMSVLHARMSAGIGGSASEREQHRRASGSYYERGSEALQKLRADGAAIGVDEDMLREAAVLLGKMRPGRSNGS